jgi:hypothetical protein
MSGNFCPGCGNPAHAEDDFCRNCGRSLNDTEIAATNGHGGAATATPTAETVTMPRLERLVGGPSAANADAPELDVDEKPSATSRRRWILIGAVGVALIVVAILAAWLAFGRDDSPERASRALAPVPGGVTPALRSAGDAKRLVEVQLAGRLAAKATERVTVQSGAAQAIDDAHYRTVTTGALNAERRLVDDLGKLSTINERTLGDWPSLKQTLQQDTLAVREARTAVTGLDIRSGANLMISPEAADRAIGTVDGVLAHADSTLRQWRSQTRRQRARNRRSLAAVTSYSTTLHGHLRSYDRLRDETSNWVAKVDREGATFNEAYQVLGDMADARQNIKDAIAAIDAPPSLAAAQNRLLLVLGNAVQGMHDASSGISDYQFNELDYDFDYKRSPGWQQFERMSSRVSADYAAARKNWERRVKERMRSIRNRDLPPVPAI